MKKAFIITLLLLIPNLAFAEWEAFDWLLDVIDGIVTLWAIIMTLAWMLIGWLLSPDWVNWTLFGMQDIMKELWILVSNVVYFIFAFLLIAIAFMNIIWRWWDSFALKTALPKFIVWVLIVPFTWFIVQFVVSASSILTASIMQLPSSVFPTEYTKDFYNTAFIPKNCTIDLDKLSVDKAWEQWFLTCDEWENNKVSIKDFSESTPYWILAVYSYDLLWFHNIDKIWKEQAINWNLSDNFSLFLFQAFKIVFFVVYVILLVAMFFALFIRVIRLWLFMIFSPLFWLFFYFWKTSESLKNFEFKNFLSLALVPVYVAWALSFWVFFLKVVQTNIEQPVTKWTMNVEVSEDGKSSEIKSGETTLITVKWNFFNWKQNGPAVKDWLWNVLWPIWDLIVNCITLAIIWITVMAALKSSEITGEIIAPIASFGSNIWWLLKKLPQYTPIPWLWLDMKWLWTVSSYPWAALDRLSTDKASRYSQDIEKAMWADFDYASYGKIHNKMEGKDLSESQLRQILWDIAPMIAQHWMNDPRIQKLLDELKKSVWNNEELTKRLWEHYNIDNADFKDKEHFNLLLADWNAKLAKQIQTWEFNDEWNTFTYAGLTTTIWKEVEWVEITREREWSYSVSSWTNSTTITLNNEKTLSSLKKEDASNIANYFKSDDLKELKDKFSALWLSKINAQEAIKQIIIWVTEIEEPDLTPEILDDIYNKINRA